MFGLVGGPVEPSRSCQDMCLAPFCVHLATLTLHRVFQTLEATRVSHHPMGGVEGSIITVKLTACGWDKSLMESPDTLLRVLSSL